MKKTTEEKNTIIGQLSEEITKLNDRLNDQTKKPLQQSIDVQFARLIEEQRSFINDVRCDHNKEISTVIEKYEQKLEAVHNSALQMSMAGSLDVTRHDNNSHPTSKSDVMAMKREVKELRGSLQECEQSLLRAMDNLKENRMTISRLKQSNSAFSSQVHDLKCQIEQLQSSLNDALKEIQTLKRDNFGSYSSPIACAKKETYLDERLDITGRVESGPSLPLDTREDEYRYIGYDMSSKSKSPVPVKVLSLLDSNQSKHPELATDDDACYQVIKASPFPSVEQRRPLEPSRRVSPVPKIRENRGLAVAYKDNCSGHTPAFTRDTISHSINYNDDHYDKENMFRQHDVNVKTGHAADKSMADNRYDINSGRVRGCQQTFKLSESSRSEQQVLAESQVTSLLNKIVNRQNAIRQNYVKTDVGRPPTPLRMVADRSKEIKRRPENISDRGFLNFYRENSKTSSFILEDD